MYIYKNRKTKEQVESKEPREDLEENKDWELIAKYENTKLNPKKINKK